MGIHGAAAAAHSCCSCETNDAACDTFGITADELSTARDLLTAGTFKVSTTLNPTVYAAHFTSPALSTGAEIFTKPETATKKVSAPKKRGRQGNSIYQALLAVPYTPIELETFAKQQSVSIPVLVQHKRFAKIHGEQFIKQIGTISVLKDKTTKKRMIWKS